MGCDEQDMIPRLNDMNAHLTSEKFWELLDRSEPKKEGVGQR